VTDEDGQIHQVRARHQLGERQCFEKVVLAQPGAPFDDRAPDRGLLAAAERDERDRAKRPRDVEQRRARLVR
jgi:hypothetical protein